MAHPKPHLEPVALGTTISCRASAGRVEVDWLPRLASEPGLRAALLRECPRADLYLIAVASLASLVIRSDLRRSLLLEAAAQAGWSARELRAAALRARLTRCVRGSQLSAKGWAVAAAAVERLNRAGATPTPSGPESPPFDSQEPTKPVLST